jgi:hypothetical protein
MCGKFAITSSLLAGALDHERATLTSMRRAALAHFVRRQSMENREPVFVLNTMQYGAIREKSRLPTPAAQALYAIAFIGDHMLGAIREKSRLPTPAAQAEKAKFDNMKTHFDTNHSTTVLWTTTEVERFKLELTSTIRRGVAPGI